MAIFSIFDGDNAFLMAPVVCFVAFVLVARVMRARASVALAFGLAPFLALMALQGMVAGIA